MSSTPASSLAVRQVEPEGHRLARPAAAALGAAAPRLEISGLIDLGLTDLRAIWEGHWGTPPPLRSAQLLRLILAWRLQSRGEGGLDRTTRRMLVRKGRGEAEGLHLGVGARLARIWEGRTVEVVVEEEGFRWEQRVFPSLSAAATAIAGSRWNGPRFFGLRA